jgi:hypothetical protein
MPHHSRQIRPASTADRSLTMRPDLEVRAVPVGLVLGLGLVPVGLVLGLVARVGLMGPAALVDRPVLGLAVRVVPEDRVVLGLVARVGLVGLMGPAAPVDRADLDRMAPVDRADPAALVVLDRVGPVDLMDRTGLLVLGALVGPVVQDRMSLAAPVVLMARVPGDPAGLNTAARAVLMARAVPADLVVPAGLVVLGDPVGRAGLVVPAGRHRRHMCNAVTMTVVARSGVVRGTHRTASALQVTARPHLRPRTDSGGMAGLLPERRRPTGTVHRLPVVGTVRRPPEVGIHDGTDRHTISVGGRRTMARSTTTDTTPHRSSTRCSVAGASGSSVRGSRCTDLTPA